MMQSATRALLILLLCTATGALAAEPRSYVRPSHPAEGGYPFSGAVQIGDTLYLSGDIGIDDNQQVPADPKDEARLLLDSIQNTLNEAGFSMDDLVTVTVYCSDVKYYADFNEVYRGYFKENFPARAFIGAGTLLFDARFELQGIAVRRSD